MNKDVYVGVFAAVVAVGLLLGPSLSGIKVSDVQAQNATGKTITEGDGTAGNPMQMSNITGVVKDVLLVAEEVVVDVAPDNALHPGGVKYNAMTFNGSIPAPTIAVTQGDTLRITLRNDGQNVHSLDFHAGWGPSEATNNGQALQPGESATWEIKADIPGSFVYHCGADGLNGIWEHIANGMYGTIIVHPENEQPAKEFVVTFSELYNTADGGLFTAVNETGSFDLAKFVSDQPDLVLTNGMSFKYVPQIGQVSQLPLNENAEIFKVKPGELTRWYVTNPGPNDVIGFHFINGMIDVRDGFIKNRYGTQVLNDEIWTIPPASSSVIESVFPEEGIYVGVDHSMKDVVKGAAFAVLAAQNSTATDHPTGTWVPPKDNPTAAGNSWAGNATSAGNATAG